MFSNVLIWLSSLVKEVFKTLFLIIFFKIHRIIENHKNQNKFKKNLLKIFGVQMIKKIKRFLTLLLFFIKLIVVSNSQYHRSFKEQES